MATTAKKADPYIHGTGRRKTAVASVRMRDGNGRVLINKREADEYFVTPGCRRRVRAPLRAVDMEGSVDLHVKVGGGGHIAQSDAVAMAVARCLVQRNPDNEHVLREGKFLTRDARVKERKKYGRRGARRSFQFSKR